MWFHLLLFAVTSWGKDYSRLTVPALLAVVVRSARHRGAASCPT
jgi:hypothetical protein